MIPERLLDRPRDKQGRILGYALGTVDGEPSQGVNQAGLVARCIFERLCGLCGQPLGYWIAFVGDEECVRSRVFVEPPMHEECARYALEVCPYLQAAPGFAVRREKTDVRVVADRTRPDRMALYICRDFEFFPPPYPPLIPAAKAAAPKRLAWF